MKAMVESFSQISDSMISCDKLKEDPMIKQDNYFWGVLIQAN